MSLYTTPEQREAGQKAFTDAVTVNRRSFLKGFLAAAGTAAAVAPAAYLFKYAPIDKPVRAGLIGAGDEGGVLVGEHNPAYLEFIAYSDIRPYNQERIFTGEPTGPRKGFNAIYGNEAATKIKLYENYHELLADPDIEVVVIALPLHLHAPVAIDAMQGRQARPVREADGLEHHPVQGNDQGRRGNEPHARDRPSAPLQHALRPCRGSESRSRRACSATSSHIRALWHRNNSWPKLDANGHRGTSWLRRIRDTRLSDSWRPPITGGPDALRAGRDVKQVRLQEHARSWCAGGSTTAPAAA